MLSVILQDYAQSTLGKAKIMATSNLRLVSPESELRTVALRRPSNRDMGRDREHLTELEVDRLMKAAKGNRRGQRDARMILIGFRHGLRVSELCDLQWSSIAFETGTMHVRRAKGGEAATHPLLGDELRAPRELKRPIVFGTLGLATRLNGISSSISALERRTLPRRDSAESAGAFQRIAATAPSRAGLETNPRASLSHWGCWL